MSSTDEQKEERFKKFKSQWESVHPASSSSSYSCKSDIPNCCAKGWDHLHVLMQTLVVTGGFLLMTLYKAIWHKYNRKIHHWEEDEMNEIFTIRHHRGTKGTPSHPLPSKSRRDRCGR